MLRIGIILLLLISSLISQENEADTVGIADTAQPLLRNQYGLKFNYFNRQQGMALVIGPYRSYQNIYTELVPGKDMNIWPGKRLELLSDLVRRSFRPAFLLFEVTEYPLAWFSSGIKQSNQVLYERFFINEASNLLDMLGAGFQEPWSCSIFLGELMTFWELNEELNLQVAASGISGFVFTTGVYQVLNSNLVKGDWWRLEWKIKGEGRPGVKRRYWDIKAGYRSNNINNIDNTLTIFSRWQNTDKAINNWDLLSNISWTMECQFACKRLSEISRIYFDYTKYKPVGKWLCGVRIGWLYEYLPLYNNKTGIFGISKKSYNQLIFQPTIMF